MEMNIMLHDKRVQLVSSESVKCNTTRADYKSISFVPFVFIYVSEGLVTIVAVAGLRMQ